jgi:hypothetical protein
MSTNMTQPVDFGLILDQDDWVDTQVCAPDFTL